MSDLVVVPAEQASESATVLQIIAKAAADPSVNIDKVERLMQMHKDMKAQQAEQDFNAALNRAQGRMSVIAPNLINPQTRSRYADYATLDKALRPLYVAEGFSLSFGTIPDAPEGMARITCHVSHSGGHTRLYQADMPVDGKGAKGNDVMTKTHAMGSGMSYGMRYLLKMIFNVAIGETDDDGNEASEQTEEQKAADRKQKHDAALGRWYKSVEVIKEALDMETPDYYTASEAWHEIPQDEQLCLWLAPTKGGVFTTAQREAIKYKMAKDQK